MNLKRGGVEFQGAWWMVFAYVFLLYFKMLDNDNDIASFGGPFPISAMGGGGSILVWVRNAGKTGDGGLNQRCGIP